MRVLLFVTLVLLCSGCATTMAIPIEKRDVYLTSDPSGAEVRCHVINVGFPGEGSFTVTTPYSEKDIPARWQSGGIIFDQKWDLVVMKDGYKPIHEVYVIRDIPQHINWILEKESK